VAVPNVRLATFKRSAPERAAELANRPIKAHDSVRAATNPWAQSRGLLHQEVAISEAIKVRCGRRKGAVSPGRHLGFKLEA